MHATGKPRESRHFAAPCRRWRLAAAGAAAVAMAAAGCGSSASSGGGSGGKVTITELDYYTSSGSSEAVNWYNKQFEASHPGVTVKRETVPFANLITKVLQEASIGDLPNVMMIDNPNVPEVAATGQLKPLDNLPGFTTKDYYAGAMNECKYKGKYYCYPVGTNTTGLFYNKQMFNAAHLPPPTTWAQLVSDAKALTKPPVHGIAFDATADEQSTAQLEPFFWSNGAHLSQVNSPQFVQALQLWATMVQDGSASKSVLQWGQVPDLLQQFLNKRAAMMENGPWIFPMLNAAGWKYNVQYGIVPIPVPTPGQKVINMLGGETWNLGKSGNARQQKLAWEWLKGMQEPSVMTHVAKLMYYLPATSAATAQYLKGGPQYTVFAKEAETAQPRTTDYGANYPKVSQAIWTAIQAAITGTASPSAALNQAQATISAIPKVSGG